MNCFYLKTFYSILTFLYFYMITNFDSHYHHHYYDYFHYYFRYYDFCYCYCYHYFFVFNAFNFYHSRFYDSVLYLCIYRAFLNCKHMKWLNIVQDGNKDTETISVSLKETLNSVCLIYYSDNLLLKWRYYILPLTIISFIQKVFF